MNKKLLIALLTPLLCCCAVLCVIGGLLLIRSYQEQQITNQTQAKQADLNAKAAQLEAEGSIKLAVVKCPQLANPSVCYSITSPVQVKIKGASVGKETQKDDNGFIQYVYEVYRTKQLQTSTTDIEVYLTQGDLESKVTSFQLTVAAVNSQYKLMKEYLGKGRGKTELINYEGNDLRIEIQLRNNAIFGIDGFASMYMKSESGKPADDQFMLAEIGRNIDKTIEFKNVRGKHFFEVIADGNWKIRVFKLELS